jgi:class 3 adenylate cyclase/tetratricopeptide (TPR) repeat protein
MTCPRCGTPNRQAATFCRACGGLLDGHCPGCGAAIGSDCVYCDACGRPIRGGGRLGTPLERFAVPLQYTPEHLTTQIVRSRAAIEGERKQVTVLLADVKGSMELLADRDPEEARNLLDPILQLMLDAVHAYDGIVNQVMGDGIMALFGAPIAHEDHALRAAYAALRMQQAVGRHGDEIQRTHGLPVQLRIGINSGEVVVRSIGSDLDMDYTAVGQTTHLAGRLEQMAKPGTILSSFATLRLCQGFLRARSLGPVTIRGLATQVEVFEVVGVEASQLRFHVAAARGLTPFVGREEEYAQISNVVRTAGEGHGQIVALVGDPGIGKSRLVWEYSHSAATAGWLVLEAGAVSYGASIPYLPIIGLVRAYFGIAERDDARTMREKLLRTLLNRGTSLASTLPAFLSLLDVEPEDEEWTKLDPGQRRQRTNDAVQKLLVQESKERPVLLVLEDLHWIDHETKLFVDILVDSIAAARIALIVDYRAEYEDSWGERGEYTRVRIEALPPTAMAFLLQHLLGDDGSLMPLKRRILERACGNPFFMEETVRELLETGVINGEPGDYRTSRSIERIQVPASVQAVLAARIDRLDARDKRLLQAASAVGSVVPVRLIEMIHADADLDVRTGLARLRDAGFLHESKLYPDVEYAFAHALTHEVAYAALLHDRRQQLHASILNAMELLYAGRLLEHVERLAHHAFEGELWTKAFTYYRRAAEKAAARSAYREALVAFEKALAAARHLPDTTSTLADTVDLRLELRNVLFPLGEHTRDLDNLSAAEACAQTLGDQRRLAWIYTFMIRDLSILGRPDEAQQFGQRALSLANDIDDFELRLLTNAYLGSVLFAAGEYVGAVDVLRDAVGSLEGALAFQRFRLPGPASIFFRYWLVGSLTRIGAFAEALKRADEGIEIALAVDQPLSLAVSHYVRGFVQVHRGDVAAAIIDLDHSLQLCRNWNIRSWFTNIASITGYAYTLAGRAAAGIELMQQGIDRSVALAAMVNHSSEVARLGEAYLIMGRWTEAEDAGRRALELAQRFKERGNEAYAWRLLGEVAARNESADFHEVTVLFARALTFADDLRMRPLAALCHAALGQWYSKLGKTSEANSELSIAAEIARSIGIIDTGHTASFQRI